VTVLRPIRLAVALSAGAALAGCASRAPVPVAVAAPPAPPAPVAVPMPDGATPGMAIPARLADGSYPTPNRQLTAAGALWHLRAGLNVAALACRGADETMLVGRYNALLSAQKAALATAQKALEAEYRAAGAKDWRDRYDDAMTRLYNFYSQTPARTRFCEAAGRVLADIQAMPAAEFATLAPARLGELDRPFTDFYRAYDAWRSQGQPVAPLPGVTVAAVAGPRIEVDPSVLR
jgi:hypothetical protein